jgi:RNA polymerase sigma factor (sigma-70 family)
MTEDILTELKSQDWLKINKILKAYTILRCKKYSLEFRHMAMDDFIGEIVAKVFTGHRVWNKDKWPNLTIYLCECIKSEFSNYFDHKKRLDIENVDFQKEGSLKDTLENKEKSIEEEISLKQSLEHIENSLKEDDNAGIVFEYIKEGYPNNEICSKLNIERSELYNILKRIRRKTLNKK